MTIAIFFAGVLVGFISGLCLIALSALRQQDEAWEQRRRGIRVPG